jgi:hypothetical protein
MTPFESGDFANVTESNVEATPALWLQVEDSMRLAQSTANPWSIASDQAPTKDLYNPSSPEELIGLVRRPPMLSQEQINSSAAESDDKLTVVLNNWIPETAKQQIRDIQRSIMEGDVSKLATVVQSLDPAHLPSIISELRNHNFAMQFPIQLASDNQNNLIVYHSGKSRAVKFFRNGDQPDVIEKGTDNDGKLRFVQADYQDENPARELQMIRHDAVVSLQLPINVRGHYLKLVSMSLGELESKLVMDRLFNPEKEDVRPNQSRKL